MLLQSYETTGQSGFILQEWIPTGAGALRGAIDHGSDGHLMAAAEKATTAFCRKTGINLAGFDFLFCTDPAVADPQTPLFLEINYFFGRRGLWGSEAYYHRLQRAIDHWLEKAISPVPPVPAQGALSA